jgi:citrate lyase subunit beta / citryl-CoA lyase
VTLPPLTWLFVPGDQPDRIAKALATAAHAVIVDLEDAVKPDAKEEAREALTSVDRANVFVRVNGPGTPWHAADVDRVTQLGLGVVVPKVEDAGAVAGATGIVCMLESALGVERAFAIASHPRVRGVWLGDVDLGGETGASGAGLDWARGRVVNAAVAAGLPRPPQGVFADLRDPDALAASCAAGRMLGFLGRLAIHPAQLTVIERAYLPTAVEVGEAQRLLAGFDASGTGAYLHEGRLVDAAFVRAARLTAALADAYGTRN